MHIGYEYINVNLDQRKTRFSGTPMYNYSTLGADGTKFWGKSGDLNSKI